MTEPHVRANVGRLRCSKSGAEVPLASLRKALVLPCAGVGCA